MTGMERDSAGGGSWIFGTDGGRYAWDAAGMRLYRLGPGDRPPAESAPETEPDDGDDGQRLDSLILNVSHACDMACAYCFAGGGAYGEGAALMDRETAFAAVDAFAASKAPGPSEIYFFGGEPLLNYGLVVEAARYAVRRLAEERGDPPPRFRITTNGLSLTEERVAELAGLGAVVTVSVDGDERSHDRYRRKADGGPTYRELEARLSALNRKFPGFLMARATLSPKDLDLGAVRRGLESLGFRNYGFELVFADGPDDPEFAWTDEALDAFDRGYGDFVRDVLAALKRGERSRPSIASFLGGLVAIRRRQPAAVPCRMARNIVAVAPDGRYYPCQRLVGRAGRSLGDVRSGLDEAARRAAFPRTAGSKRGCSSCWARNLCGGGCPAGDILSRGDDGEPDRLTCAERRIRYRWLLWLYASCSEAGLDMDALAPEIEREWARSREASDALLR